MRTLIAAAALAMLYTVGAFSYIEARATEQYIGARCYTGDCDFTWTTESFCKESPDTPCPHNKAAAAFRGRDGKWTFHPRLMIYGILYRGDCPGFEGWPTRILIASPFLKMGV